MELPTTLELALELMDIHQRFSSLREDQIVNLISLSKILASFYLSGSRTAEVQSECYVLFQRIMKDALQDLLDVYWRLLNPWQVILRERK